MPYGTIKVDTVTFTDAGVDKSVSISGLVKNPTFSGNITVTGTISGSVIQGGTTVSGATFTGTTANFAGTVTASGFIPTGAGVPTNGLYLPTANKIALSTNGSGRVFIDTSGNVGIGNTTPQARLYVANDIGGGVGRVLIDANVTSGYDTEIEATDIGLEFTAKSNSRGFAWSTGSTPTEKVRITASGRLGVGTNDPSEVLTVSKAEAANSFPLHIENTQNWGWGVGLKLRQKLASGGSVTDSAAIVSDWNGDNNSTLEFFTVNSGSLTEKLRITNDGKVAIGRVSPDALLHVDSTTAGAEVARFEGNYNASSSVTLSQWRRAGGAVAAAVKYNDATTSMSLGTTTAHKFMLRANDTDALTVDTASNVGIGTSTPVNIGTGYNGLTLNGSSGGVLYVQGGGTSGGRLLATSTDFYIGTVQASGNTIFQHQDGSFERARIDASGRVLINNNQAQTGAGGADKLQVVSGMLLVNTTNNYARLLPTSSGLTITANAYPANLGSNAQIILSAGSSGGGGPNELGRFISTGQVAFGTTDTTGLPSTGGLKVKSNAIGTSSTAALALEGTGGDFRAIYFANIGYTMYSVSSGATDYLGFFNASDTALFYLFENGNVLAIGIYNFAVGGTNRDVFVDSSGYLGYVSSTRESKTNIATLENIDWLYSLESVSFNRRKYKQVPYTNEEGVTTYVDSPDKEYSEEFYTEIEYGLIAEDVEQVAPELCFYDLVDGQPELRGVHYNKLIAPLLKAVQELKTENENLKARLDAAGL